MEQHGNISVPLLDSKLPARPDDDSTSAQYGDVSSQHSTVEETNDKPETEAFGNSPPHLSPVDLQKRSHLALPRNRHGSSSCFSEEATPSQESMIEILDLEDGGYDGDAEVQYPDGFEEVESTADESEVSHLTLEEADDHDALTKKLRKLSVKAKKSRETSQNQQCSASVGQYTTHKRTHSESFDDLSEMNDDHECDGASSPPVQKRPRNYTSIGSQQITQDDVMDVS
ncbi:MAG: hypothetical protein Q9159_001738 [Coniocarpon cinnabarinum]